MPVLIILGSSLGIGLPLLWVASRRFARRRRAEGAWDEQGPRHPTRTPRKERRNWYGDDLAFDMEHGLDRDEDWPGGRKPGSFEPPAT